jgi:hypothetical protein
MTQTKSPAPALSPSNPALFAVDVDQFRFTQEHDGHPMRTSYAVTVHGGRLGRITTSQTGITFHPFTSSPVRPSQEQINIFAVAVINEARRRRGESPITQAQYDAVPMPLRLTVH